MLNNYFQQPVQTIQSNKPVSITQDHTHDQMKAYDARTGQMQPMGATPQIMHTPQSMMLHQRANINPQNPGQNAHQPSAA